MPEYSPHELEALKFQQEVDSLIERDRAAYQDRKWLQAEKEKPPLSRYEKMKRDARGSKKGVKRGKYKVRGESPRKLTKLATSKYYSQAGNDGVGG